MTPESVLQSHWEIEWVKGTAVVFFFFFSSWYSIIIILIFLVSPEFWNVAQTWLVSGCHLLLSHLAEPSKTGLKEGSCWPSLPHSGVVNMDNYKSPESNFWYCCSHQKVSCWFWQSNNFSLGQAIPTGTVCKFLQKVRVQNTSIRM